MRTSPTPLTPLLAYLLLSTSSTVLLSRATDDFPINSDAPSAEEWNPSSSDMSATLFAAAQGRAAFLSAAELAAVSQLQNRSLFGGDGWTPSSLRRYAGDVYPERRTCKKKNKPSSSSSDGNGQGGDDGSSSNGSSSPGSNGSSNSGSSSNGNSGQGSNDGSSPTSPWKLAMQYQGDTFFDGWNFWNAPDPTHGLVGELLSHSIRNKHLLTRINCLLQTTKASRTPCRKVSRTSTETAMQSCRWTAGQISIKASDGLPCAFIRRRHTMRDW